MTAATPQQAAALQRERRAEAPSEDQESPEKPASAQQNTFGSRISIAELLLLLPIALLNDGVDLIETTGIGVLIAKIIDIVTAGILFLWALFRLHRFPKKKSAATFIVEMIPIIGLAPSWTIWLISIYIQERERTQKAAGVVSTIKRVTSS